MVVLPIPFDLSSSDAPSAQSNYSSVRTRYTEIESANTSINSGRGENVGISSVPVDIGDGAEMCVDDTMEGASRRSGKKVPDK
jgi:hypothetical protein